ncbi:MAG: ferredoxin-type protein NapG [Proteobacteria bacterium]|nr:MAG: ferredoxin-type protein NapG [Pseudomonadota bacterium]QKK12026.1 MAG: ferredoxin-type protein NapG [Pseudomonadota bacterium]
MTNQTDKDTTTTDLARRRFVGNTVRMVCGVGLLSMGIGLYARRANSLPAMAIRPPGALEESDFVAACVRCGLCVRDCPYDTLRLGQIEEDVPTGSPYFVAREVPCEMCEDIPCVKACPTGALDPSLEHIDDSRMGLAVLVDQESCIAFQGLRCEICFNACPVRGKAITLDYLSNERSGRHALFIPVVHSDGCTGCGKCEQACILEEAAIKIFPFHLAKGQLGRHYRLGWEEKRKAGGSLVTPDQEHRYNLPEGMRYDYEGRGLIMQEKAGETPFSSNPLDTLNRGLEQQ